MGNRKIDDKVSNIIIELKVIIISSYTLCQNRRECHLSQPRTNWILCQFGLIWMKLLFHLCFKLCQHLLRRKLNLKILLNMLLTSCWGITLRKKPQSRMKEDEVIVSVLILTISQDVILFTSYIIRCLKKSINEYVLVRSIHKCFSTHKIVHMMRKIITLYANILSLIN